MEYLASWREYQINEIPILNQPGTFLIFLAGSDFPFLGWTLRLFAAQGEMI